MTEEAQCPIWQTPARLIESADLGNKLSFESPRAGGRFVLLGSAASTISTLSDDEKVRLTTFIVDQNRAGSFPRIDRNTLDQIRNARSLTVRQRRDRFLIFMGKQLTKISDAIGFYGRGHPDNSDETTDWFLAWTESYDEKDLYFLRDECLESGLVKQNSKNAPCHYQMTSKGYQFLDGLDSVGQDSSQAFVAMWFHDSMQDAYDHGIAIAVNDAGYKPLRIDKKEHINKICDEIIAEIRRSRFVVADFTSEPDNPRGGVYFEAGFAQGLGINVIWTCRDDRIDAVHFDTRQYNHIVWSSPEDLRTKLKNRIEAVIGEGPLKKRGDNP